MSTVYTRRLIIVVKAEHQAVANPLSAQVDTVGGERTFPRALYPAGLRQVTPTHYWCNWAMTDREHTALLARFGADTAVRPGRVYDTADTWTPDEALAAQDLAVSIVA